MAQFSKFKTKNDNKESEQNIREKYDIYKDMSKTQLNQELFKEVARQKENGSFDYNALEGMVESLRGVMPQQDYENIRRMLESLK